MRCYCHGHCPGEQENGTCVTQEGGTCFAAIEEFFNVETDEVELERTYGCLAGGGVGLGTLQCEGNMVPHAIRKAIKCCNYTDYCNRYLTPELQVRNTTPPPGMSYDDSIHYIALIISVTVCLIAFLVIVAYYYLRYKKREDMRLLNLSQAKRLVPQHWHCPISRPSREMANESSRTSSRAQARQALLCNVARFAHDGHQTVVSVPFRLADHKSRRE